MIQQKSQIRALPFTVYFWSVAFLVIFGLLDSIYLLISHYRVYTDIGYRSFCAITRSINCDTVSQSSHSLLLGLPVPMWGIFGYTFLLLLLVFASHRRALPQRFWSIILVTAFVYSLMSVFFAYLSTFYIRSYCIMCIATYAVNLLILFYSWLIRRRFDPDPFFSAFKKDVEFFYKKKTKSLCLFSPFFAAVILIWLFLPAYWQIPPPPLSADIPNGYTQDRHPWIGASQPVLTITEFSDYQCFQCKKMHFFLRSLIQENSDKIRLVHRHFPMDHKFNPLVKEPFHVGSGEMALLGIYSASQNKFWQTNDLLFEMGSQKRAFNTKEIGEKTGMDYIGLARARKDPTILFHLQKDIIEGIKLGIRGTPAFLIDGELYIGQIPPKIIEEALK